METEKRLDIILCDRGFFDSRTKAQTAISEGRVSIDGKQASKPSARVAPDAVISVTTKREYVGRGAYKLLAALDEFSVDPKDMICLDVGASTGGFTEVWLERGAQHVFAVDVGTNQLAVSLRSDIRVTALEKTDIRLLPPETVRDAAFCSIDVSFVSLTKILSSPAIMETYRRGGSVIALVKPQFEAGRSALDKHGVVKKASDHIRALESVAVSAQSLGYTLSGLIPSPISGGDGNAEYLMFLSETPSKTDISAVVQKALGTRRSVNKQQ